MSSFPWKEFGCCYIAVFLTFFNLSVFLYFYMIVFYVCQIVWSSFCLFVYLCPKLSITLLVWAVCPCYIGYEKTSMRLILLGVRIKYIITYFNTALWKKNNKKQNKKHTTYQILLIFMIYVSWNHKIIKTRFILISLTYGCIFKSIQS